MRLRTERGATVALAIAVLVHLVALYAPGEPDPSGDPIPGLDKAVHIVLFAVPAGLLVRAFDGMSTRAAASWAAALFGVHAVVSEVLQHLFVPHRTGDPWDLLADVVGVALGVTVAVRARIGDRADAGVCCHGAVRREPHDTGL